MRMGKNFTNCTFQVSLNTELLPLPPVTSYLQAI